MALQLRTRINKDFYQLSKKIIFKTDSEKAHQTFTLIGEKLGKHNLAKKTVSALFNYKNPTLEQKILGIKFQNPIGLAAGFDYEARLTQILPEIGFGFQTIGSITLNSYEGNGKPRLGRLPKSLSLLVNKGLKNSGAKKVISDLKKLKFRIPLGVSVAKTNCAQTATDENGIKDYVESFRLWKKSRIGEFYELNISCPNAFGGEPFTTPKKLKLLLTQIDKLALKKPLLLKMPVDFSENETIALCEVAKKHSVQGLIFGNLTKDRSNPAFDKEEISKAAKGNFSGLPTKEKSNALIKAVYKKYKSRFVIIGCGGVFSAEDAYEKIKLGASLIQLISGLVYKGPSVISEINQELAELIKKDGYKNISEAIGKDNN